MINTLQNAFLSGLKNNTDTPKSCLHHGLITLFNKAVLNWEISAVLRRLHSSSSTGVCGGVSYLCTQVFRPDNFLTHIYTNILVIKEDLSPRLQQLITHSFNINKVEENLLVQTTSLVCPWNPAQSFYLDYSFLQISLSLPTKILYHHSLKNIYVGLQSPYGTLMRFDGQNKIYRTCNVCFE